MGTAPSRSALAALAGLALAAGAVQAAPQGGALRPDTASRSTASRPVVRMVPVVHAPAPKPVDARETARDARMAALRARLDALDAADVELEDDEQRVVVFDAGGALSPIHRDTLSTFVETLRPAGVAVIAEACAPVDDAGAARLQRAVARAFESVGARSWTVLAQRAPCSLPGGVVLRPAR